MHPFGTAFFITLLGAVVTQSRSNSKAISRNSNPNRRTPNLDTASAQPVINEDPRHVNLTASEHGSNNLVSHVRTLAQSLYQCSKSASPDEMKLTFLRNTAVTWNDGTPAGFYIRESKGSKRWLIFLEGGWYCYNKQSCDARYRTSPRLMSSAEWPLTQKGSGILSAEPEENLHWWNANTVAGGTGVLLNIERMANLLQELGADVQVRGLVDSGWFLDDKQRRQTECSGVTSCSPNYVIKKGLRAVFAPACLAHTMISKSNWLDFQVRGASLNRALQCWDRSLQENKNSRPPTRNCSFHFIDQCRLPHCNPPCPALHDQVTGQEVNMIQLLMDMGFDTQRIAQQLGMEPSHLLGMLNNGG